MIAFLCGIAIIIIGACCVMLKVFSNTGKQVPLQKDTVYIKQEASVDTSTKPKGEPKSHGGETIRISTPLKETLHKIGTKNTEKKDKKVTHISELTEIKDTTVNKR